ncbi:MAG: glycosyltransferase [Nostocaceae cyanobacterium]|nr:glycosyltransferase [Nostocaceae cyanobacterium]
MINQEFLNLSLAPTELVVVINSFNRLSLLCDALPSIIQALKHISLKSAVIVFDAGSTDGSVNFIQEFAAQNQETEIICLCPSPNTDRSFSAGCNFAVQFASQKFPQLQWCLFYETDNFIKNELALPLALKLLEQEKKLAAVGFTVETHEGKKAGFGSRFPTPLSFLLGQQLSDKLGLERMNIQEWYSFLGVRWGISDIVFTSPLLVRYSAWKSTEGMDVTRFPYSDSDNDWCRMVYKKGWQVAVLDVPGIIHDNKMQTSPWSGNRVINFHQARFRFLLKHQVYWIGWLKPLLFIRHCLELLLLSLKAVHDQEAKKSIQKRLLMMKIVFSNYEQ